ncbi:TniQ family protein [Rhizobium flavescens]|uniref:TniQ family protein n=1 Tax=Rhizobium flavescens TaxID=2607407 RepID=UPI00140E70C9|nr:TniQ family protein [Rhizobium flavescens]
MSEFDPRRLPFMRWDLQFERDESLLGWFARTVGQNGDERIVDFNASNDLRLFSLSPEEALRKTKRLPLSDETLLRMEWATPIRNGRLFDLCGERIRPSDLSFNSPRWCPACVSEQPYRRVWFDFLSLKRCPYHGDEIVDKDINGNKVPWHATEFSRNADGTPLGRPGAARQLEVGTFGHYLLGRLGFEERLPAPVLDRFDLRDVLPVCEVLGKEAKSGTEITLEDAEVGFSMIRGTHAELAEALRPLVRRVPGFGASTSIKECFGRAYATAGQTFSAKMRTLIVRAMEEAVSAELRAPGSMIAERDVNSRRVTTQEVEDRYGIDTASVAQIARIIGVHRFKKRKPLIEADIPPILDFVAKLIDRQAAADYLNISEHGMDALIRAGFVRRFVKLRVGEYLGPRFHVPDLDVVLRQLDALPATGNVLTSKPFHAYALAKKGLQHGDLAIKVLKGEVKIAGRKPDVHGFRALVIDTGKMNKRPRVTADPAWLSLAHVQALLNFRKETVWEMMKMGILVPQGDYVRLLAFKREDVEALYRTYARSTDICRGLGITKYRLRDLMAEKGVTPLVRSAARSFVDTIYNRAEVMEALDLTDDPAVASDPRLIEFWGQLKAVAKARFPALLFSDRPMAGGQVVGMTTRLSVMPISYDLKTRTVTAVVAPAKDGPIFIFDLDAADWTEGLDELFSKLLEREGEFLKRRSDYNKEKRRSDRLKLTL